MNTPSSIQALRRANPRAKAGFADSVAATAETLHARIAATADVAANGADGVVRELAVTWGASASPWSYSVAYSGLDATQALVAPANARP